MENDRNIEIKGIYMLIDIKYTLRSCETFWFLLFCIIILLSSCNNNFEYKRFMEQKDSLNKVYQDSIEQHIQVLKNKRRIVDSLMKDNIVAIGEIKFGQTRKEYRKALGKIERATKPIGIGIEGLYFQICNADFYKNKLYRIKLNCSYLYPEYKAEYNSRPYYNPEPYIKPVVSFFENKYGLPDYDKEYETHIRGKELASNIKKIWTFAKKRIIITNIARKYGGEYDMAYFDLEITIEDPITSKIVSDKEDKVKQDSVRKKREFEDNLKKKSGNLFKTL